MKGLMSQQGVEGYLVFNDDGASFTFHHLFFLFWRTAALSHSLACDTTHILYLTPIMITTNPRHSY